MDQKEAEKRIMDMRMLEDHIRQFEEQMMMVDQQLLAIQKLQVNLDDIKKVKNQEILAQLSKDVFIKAKIESSDKVLLNVGSGIIVNKSVEETKKYMDNQKENFIEVKKRLNEEITKIMEQIEGLAKELGY